MQKPKGYDEAAPLTGGPKEQLPLGGYVCVIKGVKEKCSQKDTSCTFLSLAIDISEGDYRGFYQDAFDDSQYDDKKWPCTYNVFIPKEDGSEKDALTLRRFKGFVTCIEESNPGYTWAWNEATLKGKLIGVVFRNEEYSFNGHHGWKVKPAFHTSTASIRNGKFKVPADKPLKGSKAQGGTSGQFSDGNFAADDGELPF